MIAASSRYGEFAYFRLLKTRRPASSRERWVMPTVPAVHLDVFVVFGVAGGRRFFFSEKGRDEGRVTNAQAHAAQTPRNRRWFISGGIARWSAIAGE